MSMENEIHNKKNLFSIELFLERSHTHTNIRTDSLIKL
jgi:hypothetical protein